MSIGGPKLCGINHLTFGVSDPDGHLLEIHTAKAPAPLGKGPPRLAAFEFVE